MSLLKLAKILEEPWNEEAGRERFKNKTKIN